MAVALTRRRRAFSKRGSMAAALAPNKRRKPPDTARSTAHVGGSSHTAFHTDQVATMGSRGYRVNDLADSLSAAGSASLGPHSHAHPLAKVDVEGSNPFSRSKES